MAMNANSSSRPEGPHPSSCHQSVVSSWPGEAAPQGSRVGSAWVVVPAGRRPRVKKLAISEGGRR